MRKLLAIVLSALMLTALLPFTIGTASADDRYLEINEENFPDFVFRQWIVDNLDVSGDAAVGYYMTETQMRKVYNIDCRFQDIASLEGIEYFQELGILDCSDNSISELDVSKNTALSQLLCRDNLLTSLDVSKNTALKYLYCFDNSISSLDVSHNPELIALSCSRNPIYTLDVKNNPKLEFLFCTECHLSELDLSSNPRIEEFSCYDNHLAYLNMDNHTRLDVLRTSPQAIYGQTFTKTGGYNTFDLRTLIPEEYLDRVTVENDAYVFDPETGVVKFGADEISFTYQYRYHDSYVIDVNVYSSSYIPRALEIIEEYFPDAAFRQWIIENLDVCGNADDGYFMTEEQLASVKTINCSDVHISTLRGIENFSELMRLEAHNCGLEDHCAINELNLYYNKKLTFIDLGGNKLGSFAIRYGKRALEVLDVTDNNLTSFDVSHNDKLTTLILDDNQVGSIDVSKCPELKVLYVDNNGLTQLDVSKNNKLEELTFNGNPIGTIDISNNSALTDLSCSNCELTELDLSNAPHLLLVICRKNQLTALDVTHNPELGYLVCNDNQLTALDLSRNPALLYLSCGNNRLPWLDLSNNTNIDALGIRSQSIYDQTGALADRTYTYDLTQLVPKARLANVTLQNTAYQLNASTGVVTFPSRVDSFTYLYSTEYSNIYGDMDVTVHLSFAGDAIPVLDGIVEWNKNDVKFKGTTAYVIANGKAQTPRFTVKDADGSVIGAQFYDFEYKENTKAGTGYVFVTFKNGYEGTCRGTFKIYLQPTSTTTVANVKDGIKLTWSKVAGADGYVIYRRAWSSTTNGWTDFVRWNNTKELNWLDKTVYAGTRYQYGIKAYFNKRLDPVAGVEIGGNVGDNYNLGEVGPLKTTVRITTRTLNSVTAGTKQMTVKWGASSQFTGYQIQYATNSAFTQNAKAIKIANPKTSSTVIKSLLSGKTYYVRVRSYHEFNGMTYYGEWSNVKSCKVK